MKENSSSQPDGICPFSLVWCQLPRCAFSYNFVFKKVQCLYRACKTGKMGAYLGYQHWLRFLVMFGLCVKGIEEGSLEKISCICWMTLILFLCRHKWVRIQDKTILLKPAILNEIKSVQYLPV